MRSRTFWARLRPARSRMRWLGSRIAITATMIRICQMLKPPMSLPRSSEGEPCACAGCETGAPMAYYTGSIEAVRPAKEDTMSDPAHLLTLQFLTWVRTAPRTYDDVKQGWRSTCPRLTTWEDAIDAGLIQ